ncbi:MAG: FapA family protein [Halanaerobacter sp.]
MAKEFKYKVKTKKEEEALNKALNHFQNEVEAEISREDIKLELVDKEGGFLGFGGKKVYQAVIEVEEEEGVDGEFEVKIKEDGIFLKVQQPEGAGDEVNLSEVEEVLEEKEIEDVDYGAFSEALTLDGEELKIAERKPELDRDAQFNIEVEDSGVTAYLDYEPPLGGKRYSAVDILAALEEEGIVYGIKEEEFLNEFDPDQELNNFKIAEGDKAVSGDNAELEFKFDTESDSNKVKIDEDGKADFYNLGRIVNVQEGEVLVTKKPATAGEAGKDVWGEEIPPQPGEDIALPAGKNVSIDEEELKLIADIEGQASYDGSKVNVDDTHEVTGDVDLSTGNIDFTGNVLVHGDVKEGMEIDADGSVEVQGSVYEADIKSGGQIIINKGFVGSNRGSLEAEGNIEVKFIENGIVKTQNDLIVRDAIIHSDTDVKGNITVTEGKGLISGGTIRAGEEIKAKEVGSNLATSTTVAVGITPELRDEYHEADEKLTEIQKDLNETVKNVNLLKKVKKQQDGLEERKEMLLNQLIRKRFTLANELEEIKEKKKELSEELEKRKDGTIKVKKEINPGVIIMIGTYKRKVTEKNSNVKYYLQEGEIKFTSCD